MVTGDPCPRCGAPLSVDRGIEVGHTFQLGTKYSVALGAEYTDEKGEQHPMVMGCYGIGVSRVVAAVVEEHHDAAGLTWPEALAPYAVHLVSLPGKGEAAPEVRAASDRLYDELRAAGVEVLYDDRDQVPGSSSPTPTCSGCRPSSCWGPRGSPRASWSARTGAAGSGMRWPSRRSSG